MDNSIQLSVIVPCYNERDNIPHVVKAFNKALCEEKGIELILVDNGSNDGTGEEIDKQIAEQKCSFARKVVIAENQGYGFGILQGLSAAKGEVLAWTHADLQTDPADVLRAYHRYKKETQSNEKIVVKGYRKNRRLPDKVFSLGMQLLSSFALRTWLSEVNAQPKIFSAELFQQMSADAPKDFSLDLYLLYFAKQHGYRLVNIPVYFKARLHGEAKGGGSDFKTRWKLIKRTLAYIFTLKKTVT